MEPFGFQVRQADEVRGDPGGQLERVRHGDYWTVSLLNQCDRWDIAGEEMWRDGVQHADAVAALERFITEATEALAALRGRREFGGQATISGSVSG